MKNIRKITTYGLLVALALVLSYVESLVPAFFAIPGMKLGLTNIVVVVALYILDAKSAFAINVIRILLLSFMFGNGASFMYSLAGGMLSTLLMIFLKKWGAFSMTAVSAVGGVAHNLGQILMAMLLLYTSAVGYYMLVLWFIGIVTGLVIGLISAEIVKRLPTIGAET